MDVSDEGPLPQSNVPKIEAFVDYSRVDMKLNRVHVGRGSKVGTYPETGHIEDNIDLAKGFAEGFEDVASSLFGIIDIVLVVSQVVLLFRDVDLNGEELTMSPAV